MKRLLSLSAICRWLSRESYDGSLSEDELTRVASQTANSWYSAGPSSCPVHVMSCTYERHGIASLWTYAHTFMSSASSGVAGAQPSATSPLLLGRHPDGPFSQGKDERIQRKRRKKRLLEPPSSPSAVLPRIAGGASCQLQLLRRYAATAVVH